VVEKKAAGDVPKQPAYHPRTNSSSAGHTPTNPGKKLSRNPSIQRDVKSAPTPKTESTSKPEAKKTNLSRHNSDTSSSEVTNDF